MRVNWSTHHRWRIPNKLDPCYLLIVLPTPASSPSRSFCLCHRLLFRTENSQDLEEFGGRCRKSLRVEFLLKTDSGYPRDAGVFFHARWQTLGVPSALTAIGQLHLWSCEYIVSSEFPKASHQGCRNGNRNENLKISVFFCWETLASRKGYSTPYICKIVWRSSWTLALKNLSKISIFSRTRRLSSPPHLIFAIISSSQNDLCSYVVCQQTEKHNKRTRALRHEVLYSWRIATNLNLTVRWWRYRDEAYRRHEPMGERWGAGVETQKNVRGEIGDGVEYHLMKPTPRR